jgi:penicillin-binding protein 1A
MSDHERTTDPASGAPDGAAGNGATVVPLRPHARQEPPEPPRRRLRIRKLRLFALLIGLGCLAAVSTVFGMMMAVASDLPTLEEPADRSSVILDRDNRQIGLLTGNQKRILLKEDQIAPVMKHAIIAIEDRRFYTNEGVDVRGIGRALWQDVIAQRAVQGGSTITQQFVKNALAAQDDRTLFQKLREAALAYHLTRKWSKERILRNYLNTIYFGNGAYGIEAAARTYFQPNHPGCDEQRGRRCASELEPHEAALLAGMVASPSAYDPIANPESAKERRDLVLQRMQEQGFLTRALYDDAIAKPLPDKGDLQPPIDDSDHPYFTSWIRQQVVDRLGGGQEGARLAFDGGLQIKTTIDGDLQDAATAAIKAWLPNTEGPRAALVAIENRTGAVRAMVGGDDYNELPFNLATQGQRQPGSAIKPFILAEALNQGISPNSTWASQKMTFDVPKSKEIFTVNNYENAYSGITTLARATTFSDNAVFAQVGIKVGTRKVARLAERMGIRTKVSSNYAMTLGGLKQGVTPLDMAHAYGTFASGGELVYGSLSPGANNRRRETAPGPVGIERINRDEDRGEGTDWKPVTLPGGERAVNRKRTRRVLDEGVAEQVHSLLQGVVKLGTGTRAQVGDEVIAGKTGTTEGYGDAWFVGWNEKYTIAVWVGYPDEFKSMKTEFQGQPVAGGTYPAGIFKTFMESLLRLDPSEEEDEDEEPTAPVAPTAPAPGTEEPSTTTPAPTTAPPAGDGGTGDAPPAEEQAPPPETEQEPPPPAEEQAPAPETGGGQAPPAGGDAAPAPQD